jgi:hypothetical protein
MPGMPIAQFPAAYPLKLPTGLRISFGAEIGASHFVLTQYLANITEPRCENPKPWLVLLIAHNNNNNNNNNIYAGEP